MVFLIFLRSGAVWLPPRELLGAALGAEDGPRWPKAAPEWSQEGSWEGHDGVMGGPGGVMGRILGARVRSWDRLGANLGRPRAVLGASWASQGRPGGALS